MSISSDPSLIYFLSARERVRERVSERSRETACFISNRKYSRGLHSFDDAHFDSETGGICRQLALVGGDCVLVFEHSQDRGISYSSICGDDQEVVS
jgi:hypothetical protein